MTASSFFLGRRVGDGGDRCGVQFEGVMNQTKPLDFEVQEVSLLI